MLSNNQFFFVTIFPFCLYYIVNVVVGVVAAVDFFSLDLLLLYVHINIHKFVCFWFIYIYKNCFLLKDFYFVFRLISHNIQFSSASFIRFANRIFKSLVLVIAVVFLCFIFAMFVLLWLLEHFFAALEPLLLIIEKRGI